MRFFSIFEYRHVHQIKYCEEHMTHRMYTKQTFRFIFFFTCVICWKILCWRSNEVLNHSSIETAISLNRYNDQTTQIVAMMSTTSKLKMLVRSEFFSFWNDNTHAFRCVEFNVNFLIIIWINKRKTKTPHKSDMY